MTAMAAVSRVLTAATLRVCQPLSPVSDGGDCNGDGDGDNDNDGNDTKKPHALKVCVPLLSQRLQLTYLVPHPKIGTPHSGLCPKHDSIRSSSVE